ncbi:MAG: hypothetical protein HQ567_28320 [Candidatus Nealsonbacteria bacterium]|nr:hypothetical protein [Candidatus Nealsonbacteria bacterium]
MNNSNHNLEEERFAELFASLDADVPEADRRVRDRLEKESARAFAEQFAGKPLSEETQLPRRNRRMFAIAIRSLVAAAAVALIAFGLLPSDSEGDVPTLAVVLENTSTADSLHIEITTDGKAEQVWVQKPGRMRWDTADGKYLIAHGGRLWNVDEKANRATSSKNVYFDEDKKQLDVLAMLDLPKGEKAKRLLEAKPTETVTRGARQFSVYRANLTAAEGDVSVEALVELGTRQLSSLRVKPIGKTPRPAVALNILAANEPVDEDKFVVGDTLTEDGRIGKIVDVQGIVTVKPVMHTRWTPVATQMLIKPGDWLRTDTRGANAVKVRLAEGTEITLGPGSLAELIMPGRIRLIHGELKVHADARRPLTLLAPNDQKLSVKGTRLLRLDDEKLVRVEKDPIWLQGFEGATANQSIGSLVAKIDGRNVPLTVGYHKVTVDIRDQIARTVIEESFVNHTDGRLEGVFYFPLPQDASISGFGMWIGNELVEADVVEKQRAREIYEEILRQKRDPGLLEWAGGNLFKARVFPIFGNSEKRIKITYTQVLPLRGDRFRYSYGLQSEMLKQHPLRELALDVKIHSAMPIAKVTSPTHTTRIDATTNSAHVEFTAQEYTPKRDFEVVVQLDRVQSDVVLIPHRRGDDGYFMLQLTPPDGQGQWQRDILPDGGPLRLVILADTSASLDRSQRTTQADFIASLLASLGPEDTFNLAGCDVGCDWTFAKPQAATAENVKIARRFLDGRTPLGWTDLDKAFGSALKQCNAKTRVIYVGDGVVTTGDCDPVAFANRLRRMCEGRAAGFHSVAVGSTFEPQVMKAIAAMGGGTVRQISGEKTPQAVALELLGEIATPAISDLKVEFRGLKTVRVYPEELPNLPGGTQQIILGRYLPEGESRHQEGEVIVTGTRDGQPVRFRAPVSLDDAEKGNAFIPRLWARMHLDVLLEQGTSQAIKDDIIELSEEYNIITPYTSLLVLESDADRERFKVKRRFKMRGAELFLAEGLDAANYELMRQQMRRAGDWRVGLRRSVLSQLTGLGRNPQLLQQHAGQFLEFLVSSTETHRTVRVPDESFFSMNGDAFGDRNEGWDMKGDGKWLRDRAATNLWDLEDEDRERESLSRIVRDGDRLFAKVTSDTPMPATAGEPVEAMLPRPSEPMPSRASKEMEFGTNFEMAQKYIMGETTKGRSHNYRGAVDHELGGRSLRDKRLKPGSFLRDDGYSSRYFFGGKESKAEVRYRRSPMYSYSNWLDRLFPHLSAPPAEAVEPDKDKRWPAEARALAQSLLRTRQLARLSGALQVESLNESFDTRYDRLTSQSNTLSLVSPKAWLIRGQSVGSQTTVRWCDKEHRSVFSNAYQLGRRRASTALDLSKPPVNLGEYVTSSIERSYQTHKPEIKPQGDHRTLLILKHPTVENHETRVLIDTTRHVVLRRETVQDGKVTWARVAGGFVEVAGTWWATRWEMFNGDEQLNSRVTMQIRAITTEVLEQKIDAQLAGLDRVQLIQQPPIPVADAKRAVAQGKDTFDDQLALLLHFSQTQQWDRVIEHLEAAEKRAADKPGVRWVASAVLCDRRRFEEVLQHYAKEAGRLATSKSAEAFYLAEYLRGQSGYFQANERMTLLDVLKSVYRRQPAHLQAMKRWMQEKSNLLNQTGQSDEALAMMKELAQQYPFDYSLQTNYAQQLSGRGEYPAAYAWLDRTIANKAAKWSQNQLDALRGTYTQFLRNQGRYGELADYLGDWVATDPNNLSAYQQYLSALVKTDQLDKVNELVKLWIEPARSPEKLDSVTGSKLSAAVSLMLGQGYNLRTNRIEQRWIKPLADVALLLAEHPSHGNVSQQIMGHSQFQQTDPCRAVRRKALAILLDRVDELTPTHMQRYVYWIMPADPAVEVRQWRKIAAAMKACWVEEKDRDAKYFIGQTLEQVYSRIGIDDQLAFMRQEMVEGGEPFSPTCAGRLFNLLMAQPWTAPIEDEAFGLIDMLTLSKDETEQILSQLRALHQLTDRMPVARFTAAMAKVEKQEDLTRTELQEKQQENLKAARRGFADRLAKQARTRDAVLAGWMTVERLYLNVLAERDPDGVAEECWEIVGTKPQPLPEEATGLDLLEQLRRSRCLAMLSYLSVQAGAKPQLADRLLAYIDAGIEANADSVGWNMLKYRMLVALDKPEQIEKLLRRCIRADAQATGWQVYLGYLLAEQAKIKEAVKLFEAVQAADELLPGEHRSLADWYMVVDRREDHERALIAVYKTMDEWRISNAIGQELNRWQRSDGELPGELDKNVLRMFAALLQKSNSPANHLSQLRRFYQATHDFRLLESVAEGVIGHTAGRVYPYLGQMTSVLNEVRDEATADSIIKHLGKVRPRAKTEIDRRALDLLELLVERRGAEVMNQPGPHVEKALAAMQRAFKREWSDGEPRLMAKFLANLGTISQKKLANEQVRELKALHNEAGAGSIDRLFIAYALARTMSNYQQTDEAIDLLEAALKEYQTASDGVLSSAVNGPLDGLISFLESSHYYSRAEKILKAQLEHPANPQQRFWLTERLYRTYNNTLANKGTVSLGSGRELYENLQDRLIKDLKTDNQNHRYLLVNLLCDVYRTAHSKNQAALTGVPDDLRGFAFERFARLLPGQVGNYQNMVNRVADTLHDVAGPRDGLKFLIARIEAEPEWLRYNRQDGWNSYGGHLAYWRSQTKDLGDLAPRLLNIVLAELRKDLVSQQSRNRNMYYNDYSHFWSEKADDFAKMADKVYAEHKRSGAAVKYIAQYLYHGLDRYDRAIEMLLIAWDDKVLDESGQSQLVQYLHKQRRYGESIAVLGPMVETRPDNIQYRVWLMHAYFRTTRRADLLALLKQTDEYFHEKGRWQEHVIAALGHSCLENKLYEQSVTYYEELIPLHQRSQPNRGIGNGTLSQYYADMAQAYGGLQNTAKAVDAACGAVVSWGARHDNRSSALSSLRNVLRSSPDLDAYVAELDKQSEETGLHNAIVRKALGMVYFEKQQYDKATVQLTLAADVQPNDTETHHMLVACFDKRNDKQGAVDRLIESLQLSRRDISLYKDLGRRFAELERPVDAERANTSIVEVLPSESESHAMLAEIRQQQDRWDEAIVQWQQVARIRALEPTGLQKLAEAQIHEQRWDDAIETLDKLDKGWPPRFGDVRNTVRQLRNKVEQGR